MLLIKYVIIGKYVDKIVHLAVKYSLLRDQLMLHIDVSEYLLIILSIQLREYAYGLLQKIGN